MARFHHQFLVIGSGIAGLLFALDTACRGTVAIVTKREMLESNTQYAQGGIASVFSESDSFQRHADDTVSAGSGLCHESVVESVINGAPHVIEKLEEYGVSFGKTPDGSTYDLGREGGHSERRVLHAQDQTGKVIQKALIQRVIDHPNISIYEFHCAIDLITTNKLDSSSTTTDRPGVLGAYVLDTQSREIHTFLAQATLLATGGTGKIYRYTSNPDIACGDGLAMAYRAGARLANLEFVQFHPTCLFHPDQSRFLLSEALRGEGAILRSLTGDAFMKNYHEMGSLAPRDIVARACDQEMKKQGDRHVNLDLSSLGRDKIKRRFPMIYATCLEVDIDISQEPIPVVPAAHYMCGGIISDDAGRSDLQNLYVAGEVACTGLHGANRLASNSLLESGVFAFRASADAIKNMEDRRPIDPELIPPWDPGEATLAKESVLVNAHWEMARTLMWNFVGIVRNDHRLTVARRYIKLLRESVEGYYWDFILDSDLIELRNIALVAGLIIESAASRLESRGLHFNSDHPLTDDQNWLCDTIIDPVAGEVQSADKTDFSSITTTRTRLFQ